VKIGLNAHKMYALRCPEIEEVCTANKLDSMCILPKWQRLQFGYCHGTDISVPGVEWV